MTLTHEIYNDLYKAIRDGEHQTLSKLYTTPNGISLIYAVSRNEECRKLFFSFDGGFIETIPQCQGLSINKVHLYEYSQVDYFCEVSQKPGSEGYIFEIIIEDIRKSADGLTGEFKMASLVTNLLLKWRTFFEQEKKLVMSLERQHGLYGELLFLKKMIVFYGPIAVAYWTGCNFETHDFYIKGNAVEVKTTSTKAPYKMHISSEYQLDNSEVSGDLLINFYALRKSSADGETLPDIVSSIRISIDTNLHMRTKLDLNLEAYGYFDGLEDKYTTRYYIREQHVYCVKEGFPRVLKNDLKDGVSGCSYDVLTSSCDAYEISEETEIKKLKGSGTIG